MNGRLLLAVKAILVRMTVKCLVTSGFALHLSYTYTKRNDNPHI